MTTFLQRDKSRPLPSSSSSRVPPRDVIIAEHAGKRSETWPGDELLVGLRIQERVEGTRGPASSRGRESACLPT